MVASVKSYPTVFIVLQTLSVSSASRACGSAELQDEVSKAKARKTELALTLALLQIADLCINSHNLCNSCNKTDQ